MSMPKMTLFKVGDCVRLRSGGPTMTVVKTNDQYDVVECAWFDENCVCHTGRFPQNSMTMEVELKLS